MYRSLMAFKKKKVLSNETDLFFSRQVFVTPIRTFIKQFLHNTYYVLDTLLDSRDNKKMTLAFEEPTLPYVHN